MSNFDPAFDYVMENEKGYVNNPHDAGKATNFGISLRFLKNVLPESLKKYGIFEEITTQTIIDLTINQAKKIYYYEFWLQAPFEKIEDQQQCNYIFDMAVNMGIAPAIKCVQRACWAVLKKRDLLQDDGILGDNTLAAMKLCGWWLAPPMRSERGGYYRQIAQNHDEKEFLNGWLNRAYRA